MKKISLIQSTFLALFLPLLMGIFTSACEENPVQTEEHTDPVGLVVSAGGVEIVRVERGVVTGSFKVTEGVLSPHFKLQFLDEDGDLFTPDNPDFSPEVILGDPTLLEVVRDEPGDWDFHLKGLKEGETTVVLAIKHGSHNDYQSPEIPVVIEHSGTDQHHEAEGVVLKTEDGTILAKIHHDIFEEGNGISLPVGSQSGHINVWFLTHDGEEFQPEEEDLRLNILVADPSIAEISQHEGEKWAFEVAGKNIGETTLTISLMHGTDLEFQATSIPLQITQ